jgi:hypothetical protein
MKEKRAQINAPVFRVMWSQFSDGKTDERGASRLRRCALQCARVDAEAARTLQSLIEK